METYTNKTGRVIEAIIFNGENIESIDSLVGVLATAQGDGRILVSSNLGSFYACVGDYVVYNTITLSFVEIMSSDSFEQVN